MIPVTLRAKGGVHLVGKIKCLTVLEDSPSDATHPQVVQLALVCCDPLMVRRLMEAVGDDCTTRSHNLDELHPVGLPDVIRPAAGGVQDVIEHIRQWLSEPGAHLLELPTGHILTLLAEHDRQKARADIAERGKHES